MARAQLKDSLWWDRNDFDIDLDVLTSRDQALKSNQRY
jgi:hypothetical protein